MRRQAGTLAEISVALCGSNINGNVDEILNADQ